MIGSHDSFTYQSAGFIMNLLKNYWRCQDKTIQEQYDSGVRFFDIRLRWNKDKWQTCHGHAHFSKSYSSINEVCSEFNKLSGAYYRIWLESGSLDDWNRMVMEMFKSNVLLRCPKLVQVVRKSNETVLINRIPFEMKYYAFDNWNFGNSIKAMFDSPIKRKIDITQKMIDDPNVCYFMDFA